MLLGSKSVLHRFNLPWMNVPGAVKIRTPCEVLLKEIRLALHRRISKTATTGPLTEGATATARTAPPLAASIY